MTPNIDFNRIARNYIWWNDKIIFGNKSVNYRQWRDKGILFINDLLNEQGKVYTMNEFCDVYGLTTNVVGNVSVVTNGSVYLFQPSAWDSVCKIRKGCKGFYCVLIRKVKRTKSSSKWENELDTVITSNDWHSICKRPFKVTTDTKLQWFQYRINNNIIATNMFLYKINIRSDELCSFCQKQVETIRHLFCQCNYVKTFWKQNIYSKKIMLLFMVTKVYPIG